MRSHHPAAIAEPRGTLMEPWWNFTSGPPRTTPEPVWAETPKLSAVGKKSENFGHFLRSARELGNEKRNEPRRWMVYGDRSLIHWAPASNQTRVMGIATTKQWVAFQTCPFEGEVAWCDSGRQPLILTLFNTHGFGCQNRGSPRIEVFLLVSFQEPKSGFLNQY